MVASTKFPAFSPFGLLRVISAFNGRLGTPQWARIGLRIHRLNNNPPLQIPGNKKGGAEMQKHAQICTIFETAFLLRRSSTGGAWAVCTNCTKRRMFSAQARRGSKRALWG